MIEYVVALDYDELQSERTKLVLARLSQSTLCQIGFVEPNAYLRCKDPTEGVLAQLQALSSRGLFVLDSGLLRKPSQLLASDSLSNDILWQSLEEVVEFELPLFGEPEKIVKHIEGIEISVKRISATFEPGNLPPPSTHLMTNFERWESYALSCPSFRLEPLAFAVKRSGDVLIGGEPLPSIEGRQFYSLGRILCQLGASWLPAVATEVLEEMFQLSDDQRLLLQVGQSPEVLLDSSFVKATRMAVRKTAERLSQDYPSNLDI